MATSQQTKNAITLKGSAAIISEYLRKYSGDFLCYSHTLSMTDTKHTLNVLSSI